MSLAQILVVDDDSDVLDALTAALESKNYGVVGADGGMAALEQLGLHEFDTVISDVRMPGITGMDVLRGVKDTAPSTEVVMLTAYADLEIAIECLRAGAF